MSAPQAQHSILQPAQQTRVLPSLSLHEQPTAAAQSAGAAALHLTMAQPMQSEACSMQPAPHAQPLKGHSTGPVLKNASFGGAPAPPGPKQSGPAGTAAGANGNGQSGWATQVTDARAQPINQQAPVQVAKQIEAHPDVEASAKVALLHKYLGLDLFTVY